MQNLKSELLNKSLIKEHYDRRRIESRENYGYSIENSVENNFKDDLSEY